MKRIAIIALSLLLACSVIASVDVGEALKLEPNMDQRYASSIATRFLTNYHYKRTRLDDDLSSQIFDSYLELLDPNRIYFLQADIDSFERYRFLMDDSLRHSDLLSAYEIFNLYTDRVLERVEYSRQRAQQPFDFTVDEEYRYDREDEPWAKTTSELDELWRQRVKNDYLRLKLTDKAAENIVETLLERYDNLERRITELNSDDVFQFFMNAFAASIEPHTSYLSARNSENFEISMKLSLEGIGALLGRENEYTEISRVVPGGPVAKDGRLKAGDRITAVGQGQDGKMVDIIGWRIDDVVELIRGPKDTVVRLEILPEAESVSGPTTTIEIVRDEVKLEEQAATSQIIEVPADQGAEETVKVGVIDLPVFYLDFNGRAQNKPDYRSSTRDVRRLIGELEEEGVAGIIIDLRNNGGGSLLEATTLTGLFIDTGPVVQVRNSTGRISVEEDLEPGMAWEGPLAVLVNRYSASASEIFAAAIQDYGRGLVIGETTFGKGTVQSLLDLDDYASADRPGLGQLKITMAQFFRVNGGSTQNRGVEPDISFPTWGDPEEYGERSLTNALPWTSIDPARFESAGETDQLAAVTGSRYLDRMVDNQEFEWLQSDIAEYNKHADEVSVSLLESVGRERIAESEAKKKEREEQRNGGPLLEEENELADAIDPALGEDPDEEDAAADSGEEEDEGPDFLLRESARIVADMAELGADLELLKRQFAQLNDKTRDSPELP
ncbi:MAG: carboxy terminal-processing peptidase [Xanthomonadales bacterium]|nr:carboxy terminal-processing peptidase [Xanthomonadales bacterium]